MPTNTPPYPEIVRAIYRAREIAAQNQHEAVTLEHLVLALVEEADVIAAMEALSVDHKAVKEEMEKFMTSNFIAKFGPGGTSYNTSSFDIIVQRAIFAGSVSRERGGIPMPLDILVQISQQPHEDSQAVTCLYRAGLDPLALKRYHSHGPNAQPGSGNWSDDPSGMGGQMKDISNPDEAREFLAKYTINLNETAAEGTIDPLIGRAEEVDQIVQIMARRTKNNAVLVGEPGVGKTAIAEGLALKITQKQVPTILLGTVVYSLDIGNLMAGTRYRGDLEERMKQVLKALDLIDNTILFIDEVHTIMGAGASNQGTLDIANLLKPALSKGTLRCIGSTTNEEYRKHFEKDRALNRRFKRVDVHEPDIATAKLILRGLAPSYEGFHDVHYTGEALDAAVELTARYILNRPLPDKAIDIIDQAGARQKVAPEGERLDTIDVEQIEQEVSRVARIPEKTVKEDENDKLTHLEDDLRSAVFGQDEALNALADAVFVSRAGLRDESKPAGVFLFAGPTGVGKTEAARQLAATLSIPLIKYDMSEYMEKHAVSKLIGSPPGYVGYGDGAAGSGKLINDIETNPYCVLLLDEMEKAHPDIANIFLQITDDSKLTSSDGKTVDFRNVILIMTTNAGARELSKNSIGFAASSQGGDPTVEINRRFSPEFRNRLDAIVQFDRLKAEHIGSIVDKFVAALVVQAKERNVNLTVTQEAKDLLAKLGFDEAMGARPLKRAIHDNVKKPLSRMMTIGALRTGGDAIVSAANDAIVVTTT